MPIKYEKTLQLTSNEVKIALGERYKSEFTEDNLVIDEILIHPDGTAVIFYNKCPF